MLRSGQLITCLCALVWVMMLIFHVVASLAAFCCSFLRCRIDLSEAFLSVS